MNEEELFCKLFPEYAVNGKPLSPYFDLFESGYEQAEKRIAELEKRCANYEMNISKMEKGTCDICKETEKDKKILDLEKENAELTRINDNLEEDRLAHIELEERLKKENAELKKINADGLSELNHINGDLIIENDKLQKENAELKKEWQEQVQKATDEGYARTLQTMQLSKAKEIIKRFITLENCTLDYDDIKEAEQFLNSEVEK